jgi:PAS domain S-box-containing protein
MPDPPAKKDADARLTTGSEVPNIENCSVIREEQETNVTAWAEANVPGMLLETVAEAVSATVLLYDRNDELVYANASDPTLVPVPEAFLAVGTRLRDLLDALYYAGGREFPGDGRQSQPMGRDDWIANKIASLWKERSELVEKRGDRWVRYQKRRLSNGYGVCVIQDITEQKKREDQLQAAAERIQVLEEVIDQLPFAVCLKNQDLIYVSANQAFGRFVGMPVDQILGRTPRQIFAPEVARRLEGIGHQIARNGIVVTVPERLSTAAGTEMDAVVRQFRIGKPGRYYIVTAIEETSALQSHTGQATTGEAEVRQSAVDYKLAIQDIAGRRVLIATASQALSAAAVEALAELGADAAAVRDAHEMEKFLVAAGQASVAVDLVLLDSDLSGSCAPVAARFAVPAIVAEHDQLIGGLHAHVADIFSRCPATPVGGETQEVASGAESLVDVLVAEDNAVNQIVFSRILEGFGYRFKIAKDGEEAVALWRDLSPRLVLMDITLPGINGFEAARRIRDLEAGDIGPSPTPIIGVLPHPFDRDRDDCFASGMNDVILKPLSPEMLEAVFALHMPDHIALSA